MVIGKKESKINYKDGEGPLKDVVVWGQAAETRTESNLNPIPSSDY